MKAADRRDALLNALTNARGPLKANTLADAFGVSRQIIVGDVAILRASDHDIIATNQGYLLATKATAQDNSRYRGKIVCQHDSDQAVNELAMIVDRGGWVENIEIDHPYYGIIKATLTIQSHADITHFTAEMASHKGAMLSSLTNGIHLHTITAPDKTVFDEIKRDLFAAGILLDESI
ncbi:transcription repressor NadR [Aerococcus sp. 1KP-2016]|jgi:transcriptional regulator of NAD metabolism|uniref:transcription repressor NadR n=1 Tax=Aerococcus sp. 1KP-2016 TaxID=1981982 RepID=UPI000B999AC4|nr:transcription repressor NadR [Aerococcus sp. 1KP-2016]OYQ66636.1 transcription repressor NadR [Aerococcus sp. 1KP-2016]OYW69621.1 MAG: transcription repressor NadR [Aerococcus viridans]